MTKRTVSIQMPRDLVANLKALWFLEAPEKTFAAWVSARLGESMYDDFDAARYETRLKCFCPNCGSGATRNSFDGIRCDESEMGGYVIACHGCGDGAPDGGYIMESASTELDAWVTWWQEHCAGRDPSKVPFAGLTWQGQERSYYDE
jgi:hypothetical protein